MNLLAPVSSIMNCDFHVVSPNDHINYVKDIFELKSILNIPVIKNGRVIGMINKQGFRSFFEGLNKHIDSKSTLHKYLHIYTAEEVMNKTVFALEMHDRINLAVEMLGENNFSALPVLESERLVGIVSALDIIKMLAKVKVMDSDYISYNHAIY